MPAMPRVWRLAVKSSSNMRRIAFLGEAPTTATFLKPRLADPGSAHEEVSWVVPAHEASAKRERAAALSRVVVLSFMESVPPVSWAAGWKHAHAGPGPRRR